MPCKKGSRSSRRGRGPDPVKHGPRWKLIDTDTTWHLVVVGDYSVDPASFFGMATQALFSYFKQGIDLMADEVIPRLGLPGLQ